ncbi:glycosyltransferase family 4 protein [Ruania halotolerans]|uniref:glycosyltransferase family 4 protein n=1 Tax=Ruania halotolerans TaxID=2897773 RepID=UPI001E2EEE49|nr:glycosyltransferase family 4 protein [Ruania halotolerans]UFU04773.1 glycosyltransferase family 4 protein [Ruania halotolerans]
MKVGLVCPYSFDAPGGVQFHIRDLADRLIEQGHPTSVLAPAEEDTEVPEYLESVGGAVPVRYNGSVARLAFGPVVASRTGRWLAAGDFDVLHIHEPFAPSVGLIALRLAEVPVVATFHSAQERSRALQLAYPLVRPGLERISARIAVSEDARRTVVEHLGGDAVVIPNGVNTRTFAAATRNPEWVGAPDAPTIAFLGRLDEPRKGLPVLLGAVERIRARHPGARFLIAGRGDLDGALAGLGEHAQAVQGLGGISDEEKAALLASVDVYVAPQTGGESFGIVLVEAMSAGTTVVASDLSAFRRVLDNGGSGFLFSTGNSDSLAATVCRALEDVDERDARRRYARTAVARFDWDEVSTRILDVYAMVHESAGDAHAGDGRRRGMLGRLFGGGRT